MSNRKNTQSLALVLVAGGLLLMIAAALLINQDPVEEPFLEPSVAAGNHEEETYPEIERVTLEDAKAAFDIGVAVFVDVRSADAHAMSRIPGALSIPLAELESRINQLDPNQWIITYCT